MDTIDKNILKEEKEFDQELSGKLKFDILDQLYEKNEQLLINKEAKKNREKDTKRLKNCFRYKLKLDTLQIIA